MAIILGAQLSGNSRRLRDVGGRPRGGRKNSAWRWLTASHCVRGTLRERTCVCQRAPWTGCHGPATGGEGAGGVHVAPASRRLEESQPSRAELRASPRRLPSARLPAVRPLRGSPCARASHQDAARAAVRCDRAAGRAAQSEIADVNDSCPWPPALSGTRLSSECAGRDTGVGSWRGGRIGSPTATRLRAPPPTRADGLGLRHCDRALTGHAE